MSVLFVYLDPQGSTARCSGKAAEAELGVMITGGAVARRTWAGTLEVWLG